MSSLRTFPGSSVAQQDWSCSCKDVWCALLSVCTHTAEALWQRERDFMFLCVGHNATCSVAPVSILSAEVLWLSVLLLLFSHKLKSRVVCKWIHICNDKDKAQECICVFIHVSASVESYLSDWLYSAGCGRTGAICAIDYTWNLLKAGVCEHTHTPKSYLLKYTG